MELHAVLPREHLQGPQSSGHAELQALARNPNSFAILGVFIAVLKPVRNRQLSNLFQQRAGQTQGPCKPYGNRHTCNHLVCTSSNSHSTCSTGITRAQIQKQCLCRAFLWRKQRSMISTASVPCTCIHRARGR